MNVIQQSGEHLLTLINDILDFAKIEAGKMVLYPVDIQLVRFLRVIAGMISVKAAQKGLEFACDMAPDLPDVVLADEKRLRQVLLNLLSNAVKFTDRGHVRFLVRTAPGARLHFEVQDTGIGISEEQLQTLFRPFEQAGDAERQLGGTGLGLAISQQFVRLMEGEIQIESRIGQGSTFWFELELPVMKAEITPPRQKESVTGYKGPRRRMLVVDDVAANRAVAIDMLSQLDFDMVEATNGYEAVRKAQSLQPDLILMDIVMPEMNGLETTRRLRQQPALRDVPIIAISASASESDARKSLEAGVSAFLPKPIDFGRLLAQIATLLKLDWTYDFSETAPSPEDEEGEQLVAPPEQEMEKLYRLARLGNMQDILQWANSLTERDERYRPFATQLCQLAKGYQSKAILRLVERHLTRKEFS